MGCSRTKVNEIVGFASRRSEKGRRGDCRGKSWWSRHLAGDIAGLAADFRAKPAPGMMKEERKGGGKEIDSRSEDGVERRLRQAVTHVFMLELENREGIVHKTKPARS